ncbi:hypothetical protein K4F52_003541 [Lecanicillium sp. MT-2017a]|nr:hypothetical protein K4F52_003541 [Lecanicillium sp. MT-2017a]
MDRAKAPPLEPLALSSRPIAPHAISWSCDAELAVATADGIFILLPAYPSSAGNAADGAGAEVNTTANAQFPLFIQTSGIIRPDPAINAQLCAAAGATIPPQSADEPAGFPGVGSGFVTRAGAGLGQIVTVEWSPSGLGCNLRPVLTAMTTHGAVVALGEHLDANSSSASTMRVRSFKNWKMLWGVGAKLPLPSKEAEGDVEPVDDRITSFSWAKEVSHGRALLAYATDSGDVVIMAVQFYKASKTQNGSVSDEHMWDVKEVARFSGQGPHEAVDKLDPDYTPSGSAFSLKWSPWVTSKDSQTATLAYISHNHVGFRRITIKRLWQSGQAPNIIVEDHDFSSICISLSTDAFVEWENTTWKQKSIVTGRGMIATPLVVQPFEVTLLGPADEAGPKARHSTEECGTTYPDISQCNTNPITGLIIHHPDPKNKPEVPQYSLVRLSVTAATGGWFETTLQEDETPWPQWAEDIDQRVGRTVPRSVALQGIDLDSDSDAELPEEEEEEEEEEEDLYGADDVEMTGTSAAQSGPQIQVHPNRFRVWGLVSSPGDGSSAVIVSRYDTQYPSRRDFVKVMFGWCVPGDEADKRVRPMPPRSTTEARVWEWLYGNGAEVPGTTDAPEIMPVETHSQLRKQFQPAIGAMKCVFCDTPMQQKGAVEVECENGHAFATCAASGVPIMAPGISRVCAVCELRCLKASELEKIAMQYLHEDVELDSAAETCGGCGGKFVV